MASLPKMMRGLALAPILVALTSAFACGTSPVGVAACKRIEQARCESAPACGIDLTSPTHNGDTAENAVAACTRYYDDQCLHGLVAADPGPRIVDGCVNAIITGDCSVVRAPESHPACAFLIPPAAPAVTDAAADADAAADVVVDAPTE
jgi:hypothetical protein